MLWKTALFGGFVTATGQSLLEVSPLAGRMTVPARATAALATAAAEHAEKTTDDAESPTKPNVSANSVQLSASSASSVSTLSRETMLVLSWAVGAAFLLGLYLIRRIHFARKISARREVSAEPVADMLGELCHAAGITRLIRLSASVALPSPVALGSNEIAVPEAALTDLDPGQQRSMLAHELAHLDRRDPSWLTAACIAEQLAFIQPLNRLARRRMQESAEYLCDEWAVTRTGSGVTLAQCLAKVAEWMEASPRSLPVSGMAEDKSHLVARVRRLLDNAPFPKAPGRRTLVLASFAVLGITVLALPSVSLARRQEPSAPVPQVSQSQTAKIARAAEKQAAQAAELQHEMKYPMARGAFPMLARPSHMRGVTAPMALAEELAGELRSARRPATQFADTGRIVEALIGALKDSDLEVRRAAICSLTNFEDPAAIPGLREALHDSDAEIRAAAVEGLGNLHDAGSADAIAALIKDPNNEVRSHAIEALTNLEITTPPAGLLDELHDADAEVRQQAVEAVAHFGDVRAVPALRLLLDDPNADVRESAVEALGEIRNQAAIEALIGALKAKDPKVRQAAADALGKRDGE
jgi:beta-lactamase regulating signal transducer with metallopeptidase domain